MWNLTLADCSAKSSWCAASSQVGQTVCPRACVCTSTITLPAATRPFSLGPRLEEEAATLPLDSNINCKAHAILSCTSFSCLPAYPHLLLPGLTLTGHCAILPCLSTPDLPLPGLTPTGHCAILPCLSTPDLPLPGLTPTGHCAILPCLRTSHLPLPGLTPTGHCAILPCLRTSHLPLPGLTPTGHCAILPCLRTSHLPLPGLTPTGHCAILPYLNTPRLPPVGLKPSGHGAITRGHNNNYVLFLIKYYLGLFVFCQAYQ